MRNEVPTAFTPISETELMSQLHDGHVQALGSPPTIERLGFGWAQMALEMGRGKLIRCNNFGNITASEKSWEGDYFVLHVPPPDPPVLKFRAYPSPLAGATGYWSFMSRRFPDVLKMFDTGNAYVTAQKLGDVHYYLADKNIYSAAVSKLYAEFMIRLAKGNPVEPMASAEELALAGRLFRLENEIDAGLIGIDAIDAVVKGTPS